MAQIKQFSAYVIQQLQHYVYRLIDPRSGDTFYIGRGVGNRVFAHVNDELKTEGDDLSDKLRVIREIRVAGFEVGHVIHRHGLTEDQAIEVEAALIDAYPGATNQVGGQESDERGLMHARQIVEQYEAPEAQFHHKAILITVNRTVTEEESVYAAVRYAWKLDPQRAKKAEVVLALQQGVIVGAFIAERWLPATVANFPGASADAPGRWGFVGYEAPPEIREQYLRHRVPDSMRRRGVANPVRYVEPAKS
jgi:hypothetical protein